jgi:hypothetical protein
LVAEKYASSTRPVFAVMPGSRPRALSASQAPAVRRSCHTIALHTGRPVERSHTTVVSRWLVMPIAATSAACRPARARASFATATCVAQISSASCSTHPGCGKIWVNSFCATATIPPSASNTMARELVVPWSRASIVFMSG